MKLKPSSTLKFEKIYGLVEIFNYILKNLWGIQIADVRAPYWISGSCKEKAPTGPDIFYKKNGLYTVFFPSIKLETCTMILRTSVPSTAETCDGFKVSRHLRRNGVRTYWLCNHGCNTLQLIPNSPEPVCHVSLTLNNQACCKTDHCPCSIDGLNSASSLN